MAGEKLAKGKTCSDCQSFKGTCSWLLSLKGTETSCDWFPSRFFEIQKVGNEKHD